MMNGIEINFKYWPYYTNHTIRVVLNLTFCLFPPSSRYASFLGLMIKVNSPKSQQIDWILKENITQAGGSHRPTIQARFEPSRAYSMATCRWRFRRWMESWGAGFDSPWAWKGPTWVLDPIGRRATAVNDRWLVANVWTLLWKRPATADEKSGKSQRHGSNERENRGIGEYFGSFPVDRGFSFSHSTVLGRLFMAGYSFLRLRSRWCDDRVLG